MQGALPRILTAKEVASRSVGALSSLEDFQGRPVSPSTLHRDSPRGLLLASPAAKNSSNLQPESTPSDFPHQVSAQVDNGIAVTSTIAPRSLPRADGSFQSWMAATGSLHYGSKRFPQQVGRDHGCS